LWRRTSFKLTFDESMNKHHWIWVTFMAKNFHNGKNTTANHDTIFLGEEILEFFLVPTVKTRLSVLAQKTPAL